jgi:hypothetical protein
VGEGEDGEEGGMGRRRKGREEEGIREEEGGREGEGEGGGGRGGRGMRGVFRPCSCTTPS